EAIAGSENLIHLDGRVTTEQAVHRELNTIRLMQEGRGQVQAIAGKEEADRYLEKVKGELALAGLSMTAGQLRAIAATVTSCDAVMGWQGVAGAGKTFALARVKEWFERSSVSVRGFAPSAEAAKVLGDDLGIETRTVDGLLLSESGRESNQPQLWVVDEAGLLSAKNALKLLQRAKDEGARVLLVGDTRQLSAVEAGNPFKSLQQAGMFTVQLDRSIRQQGVADLDRAITLFSQGKVVASIKHLQQYEHIAILPKAAERRAQLVADYLSLTPAQREATLILTGTHRERYEIVEGIRAGLQAEGLLGQGREVERLERRNLTEVQQRYVHHFEVGDVVVPLRQQKRRGLEKGQPYEVVGKEDDRLLLQGPGGAIRRVDASFRKGVFRRQAMEIAPGEMLRWTKNDRELGRRNGQQFWVESIEGAIARVQYTDGRFEEVDFSVPQPVDYAWVSTTYSSQGKTAKRVLVAADASVDKESFYVAISRVKHDLRIYTPDLEELVKLAQTSRANENPIELLRQQIRTEIDREVSPIPHSSPVPSHHQPLERSPQPRTADAIESAGFDIQSPQETGPMNRPPQPTQTRTKKKAAAQTESRTAPRSRSRLIQLADKVRDLPLERVAEFLEMEPDLKDKYKWRSDGAIVSINGSKFFDHLHQKGGGGAIDLVMHVRRTSFCNAAIWLTEQVSASAETSPQPPKRRTAAPKRRQAFIPPSPEPKRWTQVRDYLVHERGLPVGLVDRLREKGNVYGVGLSEAAKEKINGSGKDLAEEITNAVFLRRDLQGNAVGAALRGVSRGSQYKGLAAGTVRERGWFQLDVGEGKLQRVVLTESAIDAMSAAALARESDGVTRFIAIDGAGAVPVDWLRQQSEREVEVWVGFDADGDGDLLAARVLEALPKARRVKPTAGKDWNELLTLHFRKLSSLQQWRIASEGIGERVPAKLTLKVARNLLDRGIEDVEEALAVLAHDPEYLRVKAEHGKERAIAYAKLAFEAACRESDLATAERTQTREVKLKQELEAEP
ncbi:MAG: AAA family ATPase, partial [Synechococcus sp.]